MCLSVKDVWNRSWNQAVQIAASSQTPEFLKHAFHDSSIRNIPIFFAKIQYPAASQSPQNSLSPWRGWGKQLHPGGSVTFPVCRKALPCSPGTLGTPSACLQLQRDSCKFCSFSELQNELSAELPCEPCSAAWAASDFPAGALTCAGLGGSTTAPHGLTWGQESLRCQEDCVLLLSLAPCTLLYFTLLPHIHFVKQHCFNKHQDQITEMKPLLLPCCTRHITLHIISYPQGHVSSQHWTLIWFSCHSFVNFTICS